MIGGRKPNKKASFAGMRTRLSRGGYRIITVDRGTIVDAAHIAPFRSSKNNDVRNGLSLCKNANWLFDVGLWSLDDDYRVIVMPLKQMVGRRIAVASRRSTLAVDSKSGGPSDVAWVS